MTVALGTGATFAGYRIESVVGRGGMGIVYRATDLSLERPVALKLVAPEVAEDEQFRRRFLKEPKLAASLDHPNVVPIYEAGEHEGQLYLAMRFVEGSDLRTLLRADLPLERALAILAQVAGALDAAHRRGLVHRDVKPANVLVDEGGHAYLTDFGVTSSSAATPRRPGRSSARSTTSRRSRSGARTSTAAPTSTRSPACSTSASRAPRRSTALPRPRRCGRTCSIRSLRCPAVPRWIRCCGRRSPRTRASATGRAPS